MKKFRVLSDLHMDVNDKFPFSIDDPSIFTVVAGDTSGHPYVISAKCKNPHVKIRVVNSLKAGRFFGKVSRATVTYDASEDAWMYRGKPLPNDAVSISAHDASIPYFSTKEDRKLIDGGERVVFHIKNVEDWLRKNIRNGIIVAGNHIVYNRNGMSIEELKRNLGERFPLHSDITFLDQSIGVMAKEVDGILFVGSTLYTDYKLPTCNRDGGMPIEQLIERNKHRAAPKVSGGGLNDFNFGKTEESVHDHPYGLYTDDGLAYITTDDYERFFYRTMDEFTRIIESNPEKDVVVVTHHCPSPQCIDAAYVGSPLNASYISDLEDFIKAHHNIKCWVCGHVHHRASFKVGECLVVMNPLGYCKRGEYLSSPDGISGEWTPDTFVNVEDWTIEKRPFDLTKWKNRRNAEIKAVKRLYKNYGHLGFIFG